jgi:nitrogen fixation protein NifQ
VAEDASAKQRSEHGAPDVPGAFATLTGPNGPEARFATEVEDRRVEFEAIVEMMLRERTPGVDAEAADRVARAIAAGCLGERHLWRDLGLVDRPALRAVMEAYLGPFAAHNTQDMRWKKFIYRRLCRWEGFHTCRAPSCGECDSYPECFVGEEPAAE